jgi:hypothetical protein
MAQLYTPHKSISLPWSLIRVLGDEVNESREVDLATAYANLAYPGSIQLWYTLGDLPAASQGNRQRIPWPGSGQA